MRDFFVGGFFGGNCNDDKEDEKMSAVWVQCLGCGKNVQVPVEWRMKLAEHLCRSCREGRKVEEMLLEDLEEREVE